MCRTPLTICTLVILLCCSFCLLATELSTSGSVRARYEYRDDYNFSQAKQIFWLTRFRYGVTATFSEQSSLLVEVQDARMIGEDPNGIPYFNPDARYQVFEDPLDIHRLFWQTKIAGWQVKLGRQKLNIGDRRLVASLEWVNTARTNDGIRITKTTDARTIDAFVTRIVAIDPNGINSQEGNRSRYLDADFHGIFVQDNLLGYAAKLDYWYLYRQNQDGVFDDKVNTLGARLWYSKDNIHAEIQGAWQFGDYYDPLTASTLDHNAHMLYAGAKYRFTGSEIAVNYAWGSGDDDPNDGDHQTFDNQYPLNHPYYGLMDLVSLQNIHNIELAYSRKNLGIPGSNFRIAWNEFWLDETTDAWYNAGLNPNIGRFQTAQLTDVDDHLGSELDLTFSFPLNKIKVLLGASRFFAGDYLADTGGDEDATLLYMQLLYSF